MKGREGAEENGGKSDAKVGRAGRSIEVNWSSNVAVVDGVCYEPDGK